SYWMRNAPEAPVAAMMRTLADDMVALGSALGLINQAVLAYYGIGEPRDYDKSFRLSKAAFDQDPEDQVVRYSLAGDYMRGRGTEQDVDRAVEMLAVLEEEGLGLVVVEYANLYGAGIYGEAYDQPVLGMSYCMDAEEFFQLHPVYDAETIDVCTTLREALSANELAEAQTLREARQ
ncbi:MAG: hypothetical protein ACU0DW_00665, partial [Shimia sp.]